MNAYVYPSHATLYPFQDPAPAWRVLDRPLAEVQDATLRYCGLTPVRVASREAIADPAPHLVLADSLWFEPDGLMTFLATAGEGSARCHAAPGDYAERILWHLAPDEAGRRPLPLWRIDPARPEPRAVAIELAEEPFDVRMPPHMGIAPGKGLETQLSRRAMVEIATWPNLWQANMQALFAITKRAKHLPWGRRLAVAIAGRGDLFRMMARLNVIGRNCRIHPTAVVELSVIGDDVEIGAYAVVRNCVVGKGALIDDHASVRATVVGEGASIANNNNVLMCVVYPRAFLISGPYQFSVFGADTAIMHCICCDTRLDGRTVQAEVGPDAQLDTRQRYLGSCYGHRVRAGAGTITAPGRAIPNDVFFLPPPDGVLVGVDPETPRRKNTFTAGGRLSWRGKPAPPEPVKPKRGNPETENQVPEKPVTVVLEGPEGRPPG